MDLNELVFVSGKGGTGKTTIALLLAHILSKRSKKVLFVELSSRSSAQFLLQSSRKPEYQPTASGFGFDWCLLSGVECLVEYVGSLTKVEKIAQNFFEAPFVRSLLNVAPGLNDLAILGKLTSAMRDHGPGFDYDHVIVDAHSTGHFSSMIAAPKHLGASVSMGPLKTQSEAIDKVLRDPNRVQYFYVSLYEKLPFDELSETISGLEKNQMKQVSIVMNKFLQSEEGQIDDPVWKNYFSKRIELQNLLRESLIDFSCPVYNCQLITDELNSQFSEKKGAHIELL